MMVPYKWIEATAHERVANQEMRNRIGEVFGELAWEAEQIFSEKPEQVTGPLVSINGLRVRFPLTWEWSVKV